MTARYAVIFKLHYWNDFARRRLQHLVSQTTSGDIYLLVDDSRGLIGKIAYDRVVRFIPNDMEGLGLLMHPRENFFWYNIDYPLYYFYAQHKSYDYYVMCEHDAVINVPLDQLVHSANTDQIDYIGFPVAHSWPIETCDGVYPQAVELHQWLSCVSLHSKRSVEFLFERRRILARRYKSGEITNWPNSEAFIPTEMKNNGFVVRQLGDYGKVEQYRWWPPVREDDLPLLRDQGFVHPVLDEQRYVASCLQQSNLWTILLPNAQLRRLLGRSSLSLSIPAFAKELGRRLIPAFLLKHIRRTRHRILTAQRAISANQPQTPGRVT